MNQLILAILLGGILGGTVNFAQLHSTDYKGWANYLKCIAIGIGGATLVPLILQMIISDVMKFPVKDENLLIFFSFCVVGAVFSKRFMETIADRLIKQVQHAEKNANEAKAIAQTNKEELDVVVSKSSEEETTATEQDIRGIVSINKRDVSNDIGDTISTSDLSESEIEILKALKNSKYTFRTPSGLASELGKETINILAELISLQMKGYVIDKMRANSRNKIFGLSSKGDFYLQTVKS